MAEHPKLKTLSVFKPVSWFAPGELTTLYNRTIEKLYDVTIRQLPRKDITIRDLKPDDFPGTTDGVNDYVQETAGTADTYTASALAAGTAIADETFLALMGLAITTVELDTASPRAAGLRIIVGGSRVAWWNMYPIIRYQSAIGTEVGGSMNKTDEMYGFALTPVIVSQNQTLEIQEASNSAAAYDWNWVGLCAEPVGRFINV